MKTGDRIRILREERGITQEDLAKSVGYKTRSSIAKIETGENDPPQKMLIKLANALEVSPGELLGDSSISDDVPRTKEAILISHGIDSMPKEERDKAVAFFKLAFSKYASHFTEGSDENDV